MDPLDAPWRSLETPTAAEPPPAPVPAPLLGRRQLLLLVLAAVVVAGGAGIVLLSQGRSQAAGLGLTTLHDTPADATPRASERAVLVVEVAGAVARPGVYRLADGSRAADAIRAAGGYSSDVDPRAVEAQLNLAARVVDGQLLRVPRRGEAGRPSSGATSGAGGDSTPGVLDLNTATAAQLDTLPGVGPATAAKIIAARTEKPFASVDDLVSRKVVSAAALAKFRDSVAVR